MSFSSLNSIQSIPIASVPAQHGTSEHVSFVIVGFLFVVVVLAILALVTSIIGFVFKQAEKNAPVAAAPQPQAAVAESGPYVDHDIPSHIPILIAAAAHTILKGKPHRIVNIRNVNKGWAQEGRRDIFSSHKVR